MPRSLTVTGSGPYALKDACSNIDRTYDQRLVQFRAAYVNQSGFFYEPFTSIVGGGIYNQNNDLDRIGLIRTNVQGLYFALILNDPSVGITSYLPYQSPSDDAKELKATQFVSVDLLIDNTFRGLSPGMVVMPQTNNLVIQFTDRAQSYPYPAGITYQSTFVSTGMTVASTGGIKLASSCSMSLSDNGIVDFGDLPMSAITTTGNTTTKKSLNLTVQCIGTEKFRTSISNVTTT
ncbi:DUF1120 domain-containing protein, partial [Serratia marcescens]|uniref:DUF1120 domain-containing protein n=1 Tax=Serratia marcescens TaxID=615 RepID=UPI0011E6B73E